MKCVLCKNGDTKMGSTTLTFERGGMTMVIKHVPAEVCQTCGESYVDGETTSKMLDLAEKESGSGVSVEVREYESLKAA